MAGILQLIVRLKCSVNKRGLSESIRSLRTSSAACTFDVAKKNRTCYSSKIQPSIKAKMSENTPLFEPLPTNVLPRHYDITLKTDLVNFKFEGTENIHVDINESTDTVVINAEDLEISDIQYKGDDGKQIDAAEYNLDINSKLTIKFPEQLHARKTGILSMKFVGELGDNLKGFYRCKNVSVDGDTKYSAVTQFEATDACRCFPCWDEPAHKATFDMTLIVSKELTAISNMPVKHESVEGSLKTLKFETSPKMSTYLLAVAIGEFDHISDSTTNGTQLRVYTPKDKSEQGKFALDVSCKVLSYYNNYFSIPYPLPKLDSIAVPDFAAGAMENWGLITYRQSCLLFDEKNTSTINKQYISLTIAHEIAHQWFGNLVTMKWWTDLWLNEGYATFMQFICIEKLYPEFHAWKQFVTHDLNRALELDMLISSHPIEVTINDPIEIEEIFDNISYSKGASIIRMLHSWIGSDDFKQGMNFYLTKFAFRNAETKDLWGCLEQASNKPVSKVMPTWTSQTGYPLLRVNQRQQGKDRLLTFSQQRCLANGLAKDSHESTMWMIPINIATSADPENVILTTLMNERTAEVVVPNVPEDVCIKVNSGCVGFYRTHYSQEMMTALMPFIENKTLPVLDRYNVLDDIFNCAKAGYASTIDVLKVLKAYKQEDDYIVWSSIATCLTRIQSLILHLPIQEKFKAFSRNICKDIFHKVGWEAKPEESHSNALLRMLILNRMVMFQDQDVILEAKRRFDLHISGTTVLPADLRVCVYRAAINNGDESTYESMLDLYRKSELHEEKNRILVSLGVVPNTKLLKKFLEFSLTDEVKSQDLIFVFQLTDWSAESREFAWQFVKDNWSAFTKKLNTTALLLRLIKYTTEDFVTEEKAKDVEQFFASHPALKIDRPIKQSTEKIRLNSEWLSRDINAIDEFLKAQ